MGNGILTKVIEYTLYYMYMYIHVELFVYPRLSNIHVVYGKRGYREVVERVVEESMQGAVEESKAQPDYDTVGEACTCA